MRRLNKRANLTGRKFHSLTALRVTRVVPYGTHSKMVYWECVCVCGKLCEARAANLCSGNTKSCGCMRGKRIAPIVPPEHSRSAEKMAWRMMWARCTNPGTSHFESWGGRGIKVCEEWRDFSVFLSDVGPRPSISHSIDRWPNLNGNYEPGNVRWATPEEQSRNRRDRKRISFDGKELLACEWEIETGTPASVITKRIARGWSAELAITAPLRRVGAGK